MRIETIPIDDPAWREFVLKTPEATPFHLPEWASTIADCYHFDAAVLTAWDTDGEILGGVPYIQVRSPLGRRRWVSLPFTDSCPVLFRSDVDSAELFAGIRERALAGGASELEIRGSLPEADDVYQVPVGFVHAVPLGEDPACLKPNKGHRHSRNKAIREGVVVTRGSSERELDAFYRMHVLTRRRHGVPVQPRRLFTLIRERLLEPGYGFIATARRDGDALAAGIYLGHNGTLVAKYHASDPTMPNTGAGYVVDWQTMVTGCEEGYHTLDMGRSDPDADGLRLYKASWGAEEQPLIYSHISRHEPELDRPHVGELPKRFIRRSPLWVCRALGTALYRWTA